MSVIGHLRARDLFLTLDTLAYTAAGQLGQPKTESGVLLIDRKLFMPGISRSRLMGHVL